ncbi:MAG: GTP-binding protein, partial [Candidatus Lokiarchaeota archaeon]|nr:GTP-binding protein [Candidatus Lokiarchaeota archaeon]
MHEVKNTYKVLIVGDYKAGKTALLNRYVNDWFHQSYKPTVGFDILKKEILLKNKSQIILSLWDSGGLLTQITSKKDKFFRHADASVVVFSLKDKKSLSAIQTHINSIRENVNDEIPIIVFGTKADLIDEKQSYFEIKESLQNLTINSEVDLYIGSSKT